jgi:quercetin dioxygenase-like cupin family protein
MNDSLWILLIGLAFAVIICSTVWAQSDSPKPVQFLPGDITWTDSPVLPPGGKIAVLAGKPAQAGLYAFRLKFPADFKVMPHSHPEERIYTVIEGTWYIGLGDKFDPGKLKAFPAGSVYVVPANVSHFHWAKSGGSVVQVNGVGPTATNYVDSVNDPRKK